MSHLADRLIKTQNTLNDLLYGDACFFPSLSGPILLNIKSLETDLEGLLKGACKADINTYKSACFE